MSSQDYNDASEQKDYGYERALKSAQYRNRPLPSYAKSLKQSPNQRALSQKHVQNKLNSLRKNAPGLAKNMAKGGPVGIAMSILKIMAQVDLSKDWLFIPLLASFALLKDILDIALGAIPGVGIAVSFITEIMLLCFTIIALLISGSDLKNRGVAKYIAGLAIGFIAEIIPGIGWLPIAFIQALVLYGMVLLDRAIAPKAERKSIGQESGGQQNEKFTTTTSRLLGKA
jgi:hypothetical protein